MTNTNEKIHESSSADVANDIEGQHNQKTLMSKKSSMLAVSDDPFAPREGKTLLWKNINMTLVSHASDDKARGNLDCSKNLCGLML
jgi:hypothetical protein